MLPRPLKDGLMTGRLGAPMLGRLMVAELGEGRKLEAGATLLRW